MAVLALLANANAQQASDSTRLQSRTSSSTSSLPDRSSLVARDSIVKLQESITIARLNDTLRAALKKTGSTDSGAEIRPGRSMLRTADSSLFSNHTGSVGGDYPLGPGDVLILSIWGQKQARWELEIDRDGQIQIPSIGPLSLNGVNFKDAKSLIARRLSSGYSGIQSGLTQIDLTLSKLKQVRIFVVGDVVRPGGYVLSGTSTSLQAVAVAGGPVDRGSERLIKVSRGDLSFDVDLYAYLFRGIRPHKDVLQDGDVVRVPPALGMVRVEGAISRPGRYEALPNETIADLIALAGGPSPDCDPDAPIRLIREHSGDRATTLVGSTRQISAAGKSIVVQPGDILSIQGRPTARRASPSIGGFVRNPGEYPYESGLTARKLVELAGGPLPRALLQRVMVIRTDSLKAGSILTTNIEAGPELQLFPTDSVVVAGQTLPDSAAQIQLSGAVRNPGLYNWYKGMRLNDLLLLAGGTMPWANRRGLRISERSQTGDEIWSRVVSLDSTSDRSDPYLSPYTQVLVPNMRDRQALPALVRISGKVRTPATYPLLSAKERLSSLILRAGGLDSTGYPEGAAIWRRSEGRIPANLAKALVHPGSGDDIILQSDDSIDIPERPATVAVEGLVNHPTRVLWRKGKGWSWYVQSAGGFADSSNTDGVYVKYADGSIQSLDLGPMEPTPGSTVYVPRRDPPRATTSTEKITAFATFVSAIATILTVYVIYVSASK